MSTTPTPNVDRTVEGCQPADVTPVDIDAETLDSTAPEYLRDLKRELAEENFQPAGLTVDACFDEDCSLATQEEIERVRDYVRAASFLGAARLTLRFDDVANEAKVRPAVDACAERARREGVTLKLDAPISLD
jgi:sugar phosphate isomerase/epimerase